MSTLKHDQIAEFKRQVLAHVHTISTTDWRHFRSEVFYGDNKKWVKAETGICPEATPETVVDVGTLALAAEDLVQLCCGLGGPRQNVGSISQQPILFLPKTGAYIWRSKARNIGLTLWLTWPVYPDGWPELFLGR